MDEDHRWGLEPPRNARKRPVSVSGLVDAKAMARKYPKTFEAPSDKVLTKIKPGDLVKVSRNDQRFWLSVTGFEKRRIHGTVVNHLGDKNPDLPFGSSIYFSKKNIYALVPQEDVAFV